LPAHLVIIKGTAAYNGHATGFREYSDIDIQQMMGRAGRPQFGKTGTCVVSDSRRSELNVDHVRELEAGEIPKHDEFANYLGVITVGAETPKELTVGMRT
jgi:replicative superfamily II helicase